MKRLLMATLLAATLPAVAAEKKAAPALLSNDAAKAAYSIGFLSGKANQQNLETLNVDAYVAGFRDAYANKQPLLTEDEMRATLEAFKQRLMGEAMEKAARQAAENKAKATAFLAENGRKKGVTTTSSGLQYEVITAGSGARPKETDMVRVHYHGTLMDGTVFDSSVQRGEPVSFFLNQVVPGWLEGLQLMPVGSKYRLTIPPELAYGDAGAGPIEPNTVLIFEVELLGIDKPVADEKPAGKKK